MNSQIVNGLWIEGSLSSLELLTIKSFTNFGYQFHLWTYDEKELFPELPNLVVKDAREILPKNQVFKYLHQTQFGQGKGSFAGFSDVFRYKLLYELGGWWVDMDITCLQKLDFQTEYVFRRSKAKYPRVVGNMMHVPAHSPLMKYCFEKASQIVDENNTNWNAPIDILNDGIVKYGLENYVFQFTNDDSWLEVSKLLSAGIPKNDWKAIHWMNEVFRQYQIPKETFIDESEIGSLMKQYQLGTFFQDKTSKWNYLWNISVMKYGLNFLAHDLSLKNIKFLSQQVLQWLLGKINHS